MSWIRAHGLLAWFLIAAFLSFFSGVRGAQQKMDSMDMDRARGMLRDARDAVKKHYYDPKFHGVDLDARYQQFDERIKNAPDINNGMRMVAAFIAGLKDSHTFFEPPIALIDGYRLWDGAIRRYGVHHARSSRHGRGIKVHAGDQVVAYDKYSVNRVDIQDLSYTFNALMPQVKTQLDLRDPDGNTRQAMVDSKMKQGKKTLDFTMEGGGEDIWNYIRAGENEDHVVRQRYVEVGA